MSERVVMVKRRGGGMDDATKQIRNKKGEGRTIRIIIVLGSIILYIKLSYHTVAGGCCYGIALSIKYACSV